MTGGPRTLCAQLQTHEGAHTTFTWGSLATRERLRRALLQTTCVPAGYWCPLPALQLHAAGCPVLHQAGACHSLRRTLWPSHAWTCTGPVQTTLHSKPISGQVTKLHQPKQFFRLWSLDLACKLTTCCVISSFVAQSCTTERAFKLCHYCHCEFRTSKALHLSTCAVLFQMVWEIFGQGQHLTPRLSGPPPDQMGQDTQQRRGGKLQPGEGQARKSPTLVAKLQEGKDQPGAGRGVSDDESPRDSSRGRHCPAQGGPRVRLVPEYQGRYPPQFVGDLPQVQEDSGGRQTSGDLVAGPSYGMAGSLGSNHPGRAPSQGSGAIRLEPPQVGPDQEGDGHHERDCPVGGLIFLLTVAQKGEIALGTHAALGRLAGCSAGRVIGGQRGAAYAATFGRPARQAHEAAAILELRLVNPGSLCFAHTCLLTQLWQVTWGLSFRRTFVLLPSGHPAYQWEPAYFAICSCSGDFSGLAGSSSAA